MYEMFDMYKISLCNIDKFVRTRESNYVWRMWFYTSNGNYMSMIDQEDSFAHLKSRRKLRLVDFSGLGGKDTQQNYHTQQNYCTQQNYGTQQNYDTQSIVHENRKSSNYQNRGYDSSNSPEKYENDYSINDEEHRLSLINNEGIRNDYENYNNRELSDRIRYSEDLHSYSRLAYLQDNRYEMAMQYNREQLNPQYQSSQYQNYTYQDSGNCYLNSHENNELKRTNSDSRVNFYDKYYSEAENEYVNHYEDKCSQFNSDNKKYGSNSKNSDFDPCKYSDGESYDDDDTSDSLRSENNRNRRFKLGNSGLQNENGGRRYVFIDEYKKMEDMMELKKRRTDMIEENNKDPFEKEINVCAHCGTMVASIWRKLNNLKVCNACGLYFKLHGRKRPNKFSKRSIVRRRRLIARQEES